jgi:radical SAM superfamily enzyme YgiQ (UPF0313 family)
VTILKDFKPDVVGVSCWSTEYEEAIQIIKRVKRIDQGIVTVLGGIHTTSYAKEVIKNNDVDFLIRGEAEQSFSKFLDEICKDSSDLSKVSGLVYRSKDGVVIFNELKLEDNLDNIKIPNYDAIRLDEYIKLGYRYASRNKRNAPIMVTRGCPYRCNYCAGPIQNGKRIRSHSLDYVIDWVKFLYYEKEIRTINIIDDNFTFNTEYAKSFCEAIIKLNLKDLTFGTPNGIRMQRTDVELFTLMKRAGWECIFIAPESGSINTLKRMKKDLDPAIIPQKVREIKEAGLYVVGFFIVGYPGETKDDIQATAKLIRSSRFDYFSIFKFQPLPGTPIFEELVECGEISKDFLPTHQFTGNTPYCPNELKNFNFGTFLLREYAHLLLTNPQSILFILRHYDFYQLLSAAHYNFINIFRDTNAQRSDFGQ